MKVSPKKATVFAGLLSSFLFHPKSFAFYIGPNIIVKNGRKQINQQRHYYRQATRKDQSSAPRKSRRKIVQERVPVPHFDELARFTSSTSIEEWMDSSPINQQDEKMKAAFEEWTSRDQARFIHQLGYHGESKAVVTFLKKYGKRNTFVFNAVLSTLADLDCYHEMDKVWGIMESEGILPSPLTIATIFRSAKDTQDVAQIREKFCEHSHLWTAEVFEAAIRACGEDTEDKNVWDMVLEIRSWMTLAGVPPTSSIYVAMFQTCANMEHPSSKVVSAILDEMMSIAQENPEALQLNNRLWGAILQAFSSARDSAAALKVLQLMNENGFVPNARHCNTFIKTLSLSRKHDSTVQFLNKMAGLPCSMKDFEGLETVPPDQISVLAVLSAVTTNGNYDLANDVLQKMKAREYGHDAPPNEQAYNLVLSTCQTPTRAKEIVREMRLTRRHRTNVVRPSLRTYSRAIAVCRKAGDLGTAVALLEWVKDDGMQPDVYVYSAVLWTAAEIGDYENARLVMQEMKGAGVVPNIVSYNGLLSAYAASGRFEDLIVTFSEIQNQLMATPTTFQILSRAAKTLFDMSQRCSFLEEIYERMKARDKHGTIGGPFIETLIFAQGSEGRFDEAKRVFDSLKGPCDAPNLRAMLFACSNAQPPAWEHALELLHTSDIFFQSQPPAHVDSVALAYAMLACSKADQWEESLNLLRLYGSRETSIVAFNSLIAACGRCSRPDVAIEVMNEMESHGINPDELSFRNAIIACNQAEHARARAERENQAPAGVRKPEQGVVFEWWECALSLIRRMTECGLSPDIQTYSSVISACEAAGEWQRALGVLQRIDEQDKNLYCFNAAISACEKGGAWVEAVELYERMKERGGSLRPNFVSIGGVVQALDSAGQKEMAQSVYEEARRSGTVRPWRTTKDVQGRQIQVLDLHQFSGALARTAVRSYVESLLARPQSVADDLIVVVGKGLHSSSGPVLGSRVSQVLQDEYGITALIDDSNAGRLIINQKELQRLVDLRGWD